MELMDIQCPEGICPQKFKRQLKNELEMQNMGISKFRESVQKAREDGRESTTKGVLRLMRKAFDPFLEETKLWLNTGRKGGVTAGKPMGAYKFLKDLPADVLVYLTMKVVLDSVSASFGLTNVTTTLGRLINVEINFREFKKQSPSHYKKLKKDVDRRFGVGRHDKHIKNVIIRSANRDDNVAELTTISRADRHRIGSVLLSLMIETTGLVEVFVPPQAPGTRKRKNAKVTATAETMKWLKDFNAHCEILSPVYLPMLCEPKDWTGPSSGGYYQPFAQCDFVRRALPGFRDEVDNMEMWEVYQSVNHLQKTPWKINNKVLKVMETCAHNGLRLAKLPDSAELSLPVKPVDIATNKEARWIWRKAASAVHSQNARNRSKYIALSKRLFTANKYAHEPEIYFTYNTDFRGRVYPMQRHLNPQGDDPCKALLLFAEGKPVDDLTGAWLAIHGANLYGYDKVSLQDRVNFVLEQRENIVQSAQDPLGFTWWSEADKPWQFLAFCFEWEELLRDPENFVSHIPVALDGSCNGIQNFSAMLRDEVGGNAVNLIPRDEPQDIYREVAKVVERKVREDLTSTAVMGKAGHEVPIKQLAESWDGFITRSLVKRPTMTMPYGATLTGYREQLMDEVQSWRDKGLKAPVWASSGFYECYYLAKVIDDSLAEVVVAAAKIMDWLQKVSDVVSKENLPVLWVTPVGFPVLQNYRNINIKQVNTEIAGKSMNLKVGTSLGNKINIRKMKAAISPNFVHSIDAAHLIRTINLCESNGINNLAMVHDSYATHAADTPKLTKLLRHAFVQIHEQNPVDSFYEAMKQQSSTPELIPPPPPLGSLDLKAVLESEFFFA